MTLSVLDILEGTTRKFPDKTACIDMNESLTYTELVNNAKMFGYILNRELNVNKEPIVLFMDKSCKCLTAMIGTIYSGNIYVPMDIHTPLERLNSIMASLKTDIIIASEKDKKLLDRIGYSGNVYVYENMMEENSDNGNRIEMAECLNKIRLNILDQDLMYILFTSGSTGIPKGVAIKNCSVIDYIDAFVSEVGITENDIVGNQAPFYNDMSVRDIFMPMSVGGTICIIPSTYFMSPKKLLEYMDKNKVTYTCWAPTAYSLVSQFDALAKNYLNSLRKILYSGEVMPIPVLNYWRRYYPEAELYQLYGPTEITGVCLYYKITDDYNANEKIPLGKPFKNTGVVILDENDENITQSQINVAGEICVYGTCLAAGYYNNPEKTKEAFVQNPFVTQYTSIIYRTGDLAKWDKDGNLIFVSRKDYQIKHNARRIELGEIEAAMLSLDEIKTCCCVQNREKDKLVLYYAGELTGQEIMINMKNKLPQYMIPTEYHREERLPILPNGKLNRKLMDKWANE